MKILKNNKGFTLVELIVVIVILGVLAGIGAPQIFKYVEDSRIRTVKSNVEIVETVANNILTQAGSFDLAFNNGAGAGTEATATTTTAVINAALQNNKKLSNLGITVTSVDRANYGILLTISRTVAGLDGNEMGGIADAPSHASLGWGNNEVNTDPQYYFELAH